MTLGYNPGHINGGSASGNEHVVQLPFLYSTSKRFLVKVFSCLKPLSLALVLLIGFRWGFAGEPDRSAIPLPDTASAAQLNVTAPLVDNVEEAFARIRVYGEYLAAHGNGLIPPPWYTTAVRNKMGFRNHFQGIQRLPNKNYLVVSGSNTNEPMSNLFIIKMDSQSATGNWTTNIPGGKVPPPGDTVVKALSIDSVMWHAGGLSALGDILAVPVYGSKPLHGKILFYDMRNPEKPRKLGIEIDRPGRKAYAAALTKLSTGFYLAAVLSGRDHLPRRLDFYLSQSKNFLDGFNPNFVTWLASEVQAGAGQDKNFSDFQSIAFIPQSDERLFFAGFHNTIPSLRIIPGKDYGDLFEVIFPAETLRETNPVLAKPLIMKIANRQFYCKDGYCNMDAAAGLYINPSGSLALYAATFWLDQNTIKFTAFNPEADTASSPGLIKSPD